VDDKVIAPTSLLIPPLTIASASVLAFVVVWFNAAEADPLAEKSQANAGAASATEATAANINLLIFFITLLKML
jgi:hypothetical protein